MVNQRNINFTPRNLVFYPKGLKCVSHQMKTEKNVPIDDGAYDVLLCSVGMFTGSNVFQASKEFLRIVKSGEI